MNSINLVHVLGLDALEPYGEGRLLQLVRNAAPHDRGAQTGLDHRLVERGPELFIGNFRTRRGGGSFFRLPAC